MAPHKPLTPLPWPAHPERPPRGFTIQRDPTHDYATVAPWEIVRPWPNPAYGPVNQFRAMLAKERRRRRGRIMREIGACLVLVLVVALLWWWNAG